MDEDDDLDDKLDGDDVVLEEIGEDSESEEFDDEDNADYEDNGNDVTFGDGEDEGDDDGDDGGDDADAGDVEADIGEVLHIIKSRRTCRTWKGKSLSYEHWLFWNLPLKLRTFELSSFLLNIVKYCIIEGSFFIKTVCVLLLYCVLSLERNWERVLIFRLHERGG